MCQRSIAISPKEPALSLSKGTGHSCLVRAQLLIDGIGNALPHDSVWSDATPGLLGYAQPSLPELSADDPDPPPS